MEFSTADPPLTYKALLLTSDGHQGGGDHSGRDDESTGAGQGGAQAHPARDEGVRTAAAGAALVVRTKDSQAKGEASFLCLCHSRILKQSVLYSAARGPIENSQDKKGTRSMRFHQSLAEVANFKLSAVSSHTSKVGASENFPNRNVRRHRKGLTFFLDLVHFMRWTKIRAAWCRAIVKIGRFKPCHDGFRSEFDVNSVWL